MTKAYVAKCSCGGMVAVTSDSHKKHAAKDVSDWIKDGYSIETMSVEVVSSLEFCKHHGKCIEKEA